MHIGSYVAKYFYYTHCSLWSPKFRSAYNFTVIAHKSTGNGDESVDTKIAKLSQDIAHLKNVTKENMTGLEDLIKQKMDSGHEMMSKDIKYASDILQNKLTGMHAELKQEIQNVKSIMKTKERVWKDVRNLSK